MPCFSVQAPVPVSEDSSLQANYSMWLNYIESQHGLRLNVMTEEVLADALTFEEAQGIDVDNVLVYGENFFQMHPYRYRVFFARPDGVPTIVFLCDGNAWIHIGNEQYEQVGLSQDNMQRMKDYTQERNLPQ